MKRFIILSCLAAIMLMACDINNSNTVTASGTGGTAGQEQEIEPGK